MPENTAPNETFIWECNALFYSILPSFSVGFAWSCVWGNWLSKSAFSAPAASANASSNNSPSVLSDLRPGGHRECFPNFDETCGAFSVA